MDTLSVVRAMVKRSRPKSVGTRPAASCKDIPPKRNSKKYGQKVMPKNLTPNKDKTTPKLSVDSTMYFRMQRRKWRGKCPFKETLLLNEACRMKMAEKLPSNPSKRIVWTYNSVHSDRSLIPDSRLHCGICRATASKLCHCGAFLVVALAPLRAFVDFVKSPRNPILNYCDPADQVGIQKVLVKLGARSGKGWKEPFGE